MKLINKEIQEAYCNDEILQLIYDKGMRFHEWVEGYTVMNSLAEQRFNEGDTSHLKDSVTHQIVVEWLRQNFNIWISIQPNEPYTDDDWCCKIYVNLVLKFEFEGYSTPQVMCERGIIYALKNLIP